MNRFRRVAPSAIAGFSVAAGFAVYQEWSLPEFCWSTWLAGLVFTWGCIVSAFIHILVSVRQEKTKYVRHFPFLSRLSMPALFAGVGLAALGASLLAFRIYNFMFAFYGLFLSVFAEMEPISLFGRNGFINSDFYTPIRYLLKRFWPMALGLVLANYKVYMHPRPWKRLMIPLERELVRLHIMVLALPFFSLIAWIFVGDRYQTIAIVLLMGVLYLMPDNPPDNVGGSHNSSPDGETPADGLP